MTGPVRYAVLPDFAAAQAAGHPCMGRDLGRFAVLTWWPGDPHAVEVCFGLKTWLLALSLLQDGLDGPAGLGDVFVAPAPGYRLEVVLDSPDEHIALHFSTVAVRAFVEDVAAVWEPVEIDDRELAEWIARAAS